MGAQTHAVLLVADISGFTKFMKQHDLNQNHAKQIVVRLLKAIIKAAKPPLTVAELEGDAVFFYAPTDEKNIAKTAGLVKSQIINLFNSFKNELTILRNMDVCVCEACNQVGDLKLKQVVHTGEIETERIHKSDKLFGVDVIVVHRMLKNSVPSNEYLMMTDSAYENFNGFYGLKPAPFKENFEGIGEVDTQVFYGEDISGLPDVVLNSNLKPTFKERMKWKFRLIPLTLLELAKIKRVKGNFRNLPE